MTSRWATIALPTLSWGLKELWEIIGVAPLPHLRMLSLSPMHLRMLSLNPMHLRTLFFIPIHCSEPASTSTQNDYHGRGNQQRTSRQCSGLSYQHRTHQHRRTTSLGSPLSLKVEVFTIATALEEVPSPIRHTPHPRIQGSGRTRR